MAAKSPSFEDLRRIELDHDPSLLNDDALARLAKLFNRQIVLCCCNGGPWYDLHPSFRRSKPVIRQMGSPPDDAPSD